MIGGAFACSHGAGYGISSGHRCAKSVSCIGMCGSWGACSKTCGAGTQTGTFAFTTPAANGGAACAAKAGATKSRACGNPSLASYTCVATGAALVAKLKAAKSGDKLALICTAAACCVISGVQLKVPKTVEVKLEYATMKDYTVRSPLLPHAPRAPLLPCG